MILLPTGTGETQNLPTPPLRFHGLWVLPDGQRMLFAANEPGHGARVYLGNLQGGQPHPITPEGTAPVSYSQSLSFDGKYVLAVEPDGSSVFYAVDTGERHTIAGLQPGEVAIAWTGDGRGVYAYQSALPTKVYEVDWASGRRQLWKELLPADVAGVTFIRSPHISADGKSYAYSYNRILSQLYLVDGLR